MADMRDMGVLWCGQPGSQVVKKGGTVDGDGAVNTNAQEEEVPVGRCVVYPISLLAPHFALHMIAPMACKGMP